MSHNEEFRNLHSLLSIVRQLNDAGPDV